MISAIAPVEIESKTPDLQKRGEIFECFGPVTVTIACDRRGVMAKVSDLIGQ